jgi:hypothetical protein
MRHERSSSLCRSRRDNPRRYRFKSSFEFEPVIIKQLENHRLLEPDIGDGESTAITNAA